MRGAWFVIAVVVTVEGSAIAASRAPDPRCTTDTECAAGSFCQTGRCAPKRAIGVTCAADSGCLNGHCVDGLCCATDCTDQCAACNVRGSHGRCVPVTGPPVAGRVACGDGSVCSGQCDGVHRDACTFPPATRVCGRAGCSDDAVRTEARCTGAGSCAPPEVKSCVPYTCDDTPACLSACVEDDDCAAGYDCESNRCVARLSNGTACSEGRTCLSGACSDGVCCDSACGDACDRCDLPGHVGTCTMVTKGTLPEASGCAHLLCDGTTASCPTTCRSAAECEPQFTCESGSCVARRDQGQPCLTADQCLAGACTDGVCCDSTCEGTCASCRAPEHVGTCTFISGTPAAERGGCGSAGACAGRCDGTRAVCHFPDSGTLCGVGTCEAAVAQDPPACDGHGQCSPGGRHDCPTDCDRGQCASTALRSDDSGCATGGLGSMSALGLVVAVGLTRPWRRRGALRESRERDEAGST